MSVENTQVGKPGPVLFVVGADSFCVAFSLIFGASLPGDIGVGKGMRR